MTFTTDRLTIEQLDTRLAERTLRDNRDVMGITLSLREYEDLKGIANALAGKDDERHFAEVTGYRHPYLGITIPIEVDEDLPPGEVRFRY